MNINTLAKIARNYEIKNSNSLRDSIVSEYTEILNSLNTIDESVINKSIEHLPVYKINEGLFNRKKNEKIEKEEPKKEYIAPTKDHYNKAVQIAKTLLNGKYKSIKSAFKVEKYNPEDNYTPILYYEVDSLKLKSMDEYNAKFGDPSYHLLEDIKKELNQKHNILVSMDMDGTNDGFVYIQNDTIVKESIEEGYAIDLDSLKYVVESENITLKEAVQKIRDVNYIGDTYPMYCVLREGFNEKMSVDNFCTLYKSLYEAEIILACTDKVSCDDFVNERAGTFRGVIDKLKLKILKDPKKINKIIEDCKKGNEKAKKELDRFNSLASNKQTAEVVAKASGYYIYAAAAGFTLGYLCPLYLGLPMSVLSVIGISDIKTRSGKALASSPTEYTTAIKNTIKSNNEIIKACNEKLKELENKK